MEIRVGPVPASLDSVGTTGEEGAQDRRLADLAERFPRAAATLFEIPAGQEAFAHMAALDRRWAQALRGELPQGVLVETNRLPRAQEQFDVIVAGGGIGLFSATLLAQRGYRVLVFDARRVGAIHRMWNISARELAALVDQGFCSWADLEPIILRRYRQGVVRVSSTASEPPRELALEGVLDLALDAAQLLELARQRFLAAGGTVLDGRLFRRAHLASSGHVSSVIDLETADERCERYATRLLINAMGVLSPLTLALHGGLPFGGVCPTVGTLARGFCQGHGPREVDLDCGEVLVSIDGGSDGRQLLWEGFPGRDDELTVYLFYYDAVRRGTGAVPQSLLALFEQYVTLLPTYKAPGLDFAHLRALYGFIPAHYRHSVPKGAGRRVRGVLSIGDAAAEHSALTFCGFGSHIRNLGRICELTDYALRHDLLEPPQLALIGAAQPNLAFHGLFSRFMRPWQGHDDVNALLGAVCAALDDLDPPTVRRFFQDRSSVYDYSRILTTLGRQSPWVVPMAGRVLGWRDSLRHFRDIAGYLAGSLLRLPGHLLERPGVARLLHLADEQPRLGLALRRLRSLVQVMKDS